MRWFDSPPCARMELKFTSEDHLELTGPSTGSLVMGGATAVFGGVFATFGLRFLRLPIPLPFKLIPLAFTAIGGGIAAAGATAALSSCTVEAKRGEGLSLRWKVPLRDERTLRLRPEELQGFEVTEHAHRSDDNGFDRVTMEFRLVAVAKSGRAIEVESFGTRMQAQLRLSALQKILS